MTIMTIGYDDLDLIALSHTTCNCWWGCTAKDLEPDKPELKSLLTICCVHDIGQVI